jgi:hypothetical protein
MSLGTRTRVSEGSCRPASRLSSVLPPSIGAEGLVGGPPPQSLRPPGRRLHRTPVQLRRHRRRARTGPAPTPRARPHRDSARDPYRTGTHAPPAAGAVGAALVIQFGSRSSSPVASGLRRWNAHLLFKQDWPRDGGCLRRCLVPKHSLRLVLTIGREGFRFAGGQDERGGRYASSRAV